MDDDGDGLTDCVDGDCVADPACSALCADGTSEQTFSNGMVGCSGVGSWPGRASLCGAGSAVCSGVTDPEGNVCNWTNCGLETQLPNEFFGGCTTNLTAITRSL